MQTDKFHNLIMVFCTATNWTIFSLPILSSMRLCLFVFQNKNLCTESSRGNKDYIYDYNKQPHAMMPTKKKDRKKIIYFVSYVFRKQYSDIFCVLYHLRLNRRAAPHPLLKCFKWKWYANVKKITRQHIFYDISNGFYGVWKYFFSIEYTGPSLASIKFLKIITALFFWITPDV